MKVSTIINNNKLVGMIKLQDEVLQQLTNDKAILLTQEINIGDSQLLTFKLNLVDLK